MHACTSPKCGKRFQEDSRSRVPLNTGSLVTVTTTHVQVGKRRISPAAGQSAGNIDKQESGEASHQVGSSHHRHAQEWFLDTCRACYPLRPGLMCVGSSYRAQPRQLSAEQAIQHQCSANILLCPPPALAFQMSKCLNLIIMMAFVETKNGKLV